MFAELKHTILLLFTTEQFKQTVIFILGKKFKKMDWKPSKIKQAGKFDPPESKQHATSLARQLKKCPQAKSALHSVNTV